MKNKMLHLLTFIALAAFIAVGYFYFLDGSLVNKILVLRTDPVTEREAYHPGEDVAMHLSYCKYRNLPALVEWTLIDDTITFYSPAIRSTSQVGCFDKLVPIETLPKTLAPGTYHFAGTLTYRANGIKTVVFQLKTNEFKIER